MTRILPGTLRTDSLNVSTTSDGPLGTMEEAAGLLLSSTAWALAEVAGAINRATTVTSRPAAAASRANQRRGATVMPAMVADRCGSRRPESGEGLNSAQPPVPRGRDRVS
jgi:hypothetical protein